jgi:putative Holliday junction resolvase
MKILAIDPGGKRVGLAASDALHLTTRLLPVLQVKSLKSSVPELVTLIGKEEFAKIIVGLPLNMDGSEGGPAKEARALAATLSEALKKKQLNCEVELWDERLTSFEAEQRARQQGVAKAKAKAFLDSVAAEVLLEDYLASHPEGKK